MVQDSFCAKSEEKKVCKAKDNNMPQADDKNKNLRPRRSVKVEAQSAQNNFQTWRPPLMSSLREQ